MAMRMVNGCVGELEQTGGRRGALMFCLNSDHPDVLSFIAMKDTDGSIRNANISVNFNSSLRTAGANNPTVDAVLRRAVLHGEPGILNGHLANEENNIWYYRQLISTNPCGEIWLEPYGCCCLGHLNLPEFVSENGWNYRRLEYVVRTGVRFLDNVLTVNTYPLPEIEENCQKVRRIGLGVMGLAHALALQGRAYGDEDSISDLFSFIRDAAYMASIELAAEKGPFQRYDPRFLQSGFAQRLPQEIRRGIERNGIRNCAMLTVAPTGTVSTMMNVSPGIEPIMGRSYTRIWRDGDVWTKVACSDPLLDDPSVDPALLQTGPEISLHDHLRVQLLVQGFVDNSVSKTINVPAGLDPDEVVKTVSGYLPLLKGITIYPQGSREGNPFAEDGEPVAEACAMGGECG